MPVTPDEFVTNPFEEEYAMREHTGESQDVPMYGAISWTLDELAATPGISFPITRDVFASDHPDMHVRQSIVRLFDTAIYDRNSEVVQHMVQRGLVSPDVPCEDGHSPLAHAVLAGNIFMVKLLLDLGADINLQTAQRHNDYALEPWRRKRYGNGPLPELVRSPLMLAAAEGRLAIVRLLLDAGADDAAVAPDGQLALRLAADNGHRDIVNVLPARRGGAFRRWQHHNERVVARIKRPAQAIYAVLRFFAWVLPKALFWSLPKWLGGGVARSVADAFRSLGPLSTQLRRKAAAIPAHLRQAAAWVLRALRTLPAAIGRGMRATGAFAHRASRGAYHWLAKLPPLVGEWVPYAARSAGRGIVRGARWTAHTTVASARWTAHTTVASARWTGHAAVASARWTGHATVASARWTGEQIKAAPYVLWRGTLATGRFARAAALLMRDLAASAGRGVRALAQRLWRWLVGLPAVFKAVGAALGRAGGALAGALGRVLTTQFSLLHTAALAVVSAIARARSVSLRDVWNGVCAMVGAMADVPHQLWRVLVTVGCASLELVDKLFGVVGNVVVFTVLLLGKAVLYIPAKLGEIAVAAGSSLKKGAHEVAVFVNPKI